MANENFYWTGASCITLKRDMIHKKCKWAYGNFSGNQIAFVNLAFRTFFNARRNIMKYGDPVHRKDMTEHLEDIATTGSGWGVNDMKEACEHVYGNENDQYCWTDNTTESASFDGWTQGQHVIPSVSAAFPESIVNFVRSMNGELKKIDLSFLTKTFPDVDKVINAFQRDKYDGVVEVVKEVHKQVKNVGKFLWLVPDKQKLTFGKVAKAFSYTSTLTTFNNALSTMQKYKSAGFNSKTSAAFVALQEALGCVPVLGGFYGKMVDQLPDFFTQIKNGFASRQQKILNYATLP